MPADQKQASYLFAGAVALVLGAVALVGIDYTETRDRAAKVPLHAQRLQAVETSVKDASREQAQATRELRVAVQELRETIAGMR